MSLNLEQFAGANDFPVVDAGDYEVTLKIEKRRTKDGSKDFANLDFVIREDVDQKFKGSHIFDKAWRDLQNPQWFDLKKLGSILITQKDKPNYKTSFDEVDECIQYLNGVCLIITVEKKWDDYAGKEVNSVKYLSYKPSKAGTVTAFGPESETKAEPFNPDIVDADLPF